MTVDLPSGIVLASEVYSEFDADARARKVSFLDGTWSYTEYACCGAQTVTNRDGMVITHQRDALKRVVSTITAGITTSNHFDAAGRVLAVTRTAGGTTLTNHSATFDLAGRQVSFRDALGHPTWFSESLPPLVRGQTNADGGTVITTLFRDGQVASVTGTAVFPARHEYGVESDGGVNRFVGKEIKLDGAGNDTSQWTQTYTDGAGRAYKTVYAGAGGPYEQSFFNGQGQLVKHRDPDGVSTLFGYNARGERAYTAIDSNRNDEIDFTGQDRITQTTNDVLAAHGTNVVRTRTYTWATDGDDTATLVSTVERSVEGFKSWTEVAGAVSSSVKTLPSGGAFSVTDTAPDGSYSMTLYQTSRVASVTRFDSNDVQVAKTTLGYDAHGRRVTATDARNGTTVYGYDNADRVTSVTTPPPGTVGGNAQTTTSELDAMGRTTNVIQADGIGVATVYSVRGEVLRTSGSRTYPVGYAYDAQGRMTRMTNWSGFSASAGARVTTWHFDATRGWLTNKVYDDGKGTKYSYTDAGRLSTRRWARGTNTTYAYNVFGDLQSVSYDDGNTPAVTFTYDRQGRQRTVTRGGDAWAFFHDSGGRRLSEVGAAGTMNGLRVTNTFDGWGRRTGVDTVDGGTTLTAHAYGYDAAGRLGSAADGSHSATYSYIANSGWAGQIVFKQSTTTRMTTTKHYDALNRLESISSQPSAAGVTPVSSSYTYNDANQRTRVDLADGSFWLYGYDVLGQVTSGKRFWNDWAPVAGQQFEYGFDDIGNRTGAKAGGDATGSGLRSAAFSANALNQLTQRDVPPYLNVIGVATATATNVNVNDVLAERKGEYYRVELGVDNSAGAVWQGITNRAVQNGTTNSATGSLFLPRTPEVFGYDADGNLTNDGRWAWRR